MELFDWINFILSIVTSLVLLSFIMAGVKWYVSKTEPRVVPTSTTNETVNVVVSKIPRWLYKTMVFLFSCVSIYIVGQAFSLPLNFHIVKDPANAGLSMLRIGIALPFITIGYDVYGDKIVKNLILGILKSTKFKGIPVITEDDYIGMSKEVKQ